MQYKKDPYRLCINVSTSRMISSRSGSPLFARSSILWRLKCRTGRGDPQLVEGQNFPQALAPPPPLATLRLGPRPHPPRSRTPRRLRPCARLESSSSPKISASSSSSTCRQSWLAPPRPNASYRMLYRAQQTLNTLSTRVMLLSQMPTFRMLYCLFRIPKKHSTFFRSDSKAFDHVQSPVPNWGC